MPTDFTPLPALLGGALIGMATVVLLALNGRIAGVSGIANAAFGKNGIGRGWRLAFLIGLPLGAGLAWLLMEGAGMAATAAAGDLNVFVVIAAGVLVGFGTRLGSGCTSGHGICGLARLSPRSLVAVIAFMATGMVTVALVRHVLS
jgi:uncharacterized membrane protein YedE/YeeE